jgi:hypothetical protein
MTARRRAGRDRASQDPEAIRRASAIGKRRAPSGAGIALGLAVLVTACAGAAPERASSIVCTAAYRISTSEPLTEPDTIRLEDTDTVQSLPYIYLELHAQYTAGRVDGERALRLWVTPTGEDTEVVSQLFQLPTDRGPTDQFRGGHGFTGLTYAYGPVSGAELQYWCEAR